MESEQVALQVKRSCWFVKFVECFFFAMAGINTLAMVFEILPRKILQKLGNGFFEKILIGQAIITILFAICYSIYWHKKELKQTINSPRLHAIFLAVLRYWLAFELCTYGFAKILKTQFGHSFSRDDTAIGNLNGFDLTWHYFSYSYALAVIIAICQIGGSILLLFRRTTLLAATILIPIMINILLINVFYHIASGAFANSVLFALGLIYLLLLRWQDLKKVFLQNTSALPALRLGNMKWLLKLLPVAGGFLLIYYFTLKNSPTLFPGKWKVDLLVRNRDTMATDTWLKDSTVWSTVYMEENGWMSICPNPYVFEESNSTYGQYTFDTVKNKLQLILFGKKDEDTMQVAVKKYNGKTMEWHGQLKKDSFVLLLSKVKASK